ANPRSMVSPRRFSSASRSGSIPVSRRINADLPWSTWPAVAITRSGACSLAPIADGEPAAAIWSRRSALFERVPHGSQQPVVVLGRDGAEVEHERAILDPAEHRWPSLSKASGDTRRDVGGDHELC